MIRRAALLPFAAALDCVWRSTVHGASGWADASCALGAKSGWKEETHMEIHGNL
jgi:hypothetical protein